MQLIINIKGLFDIILSYMSVILVEYPIILINLKTYLEGMGEKAASLAKIAEKVHIKTGVSIAIAPQPTDLLLVAESTETPVFAQHIDPIKPGSFTGHILPEAVVDAGCTGVLINHSERRLSLETIRATIKRAKEVDLISLVCVDSVQKGEEVAILDPNIIAIEPPELIGSGISVSKAQPEIVAGAVEAVEKVNSNVKVLCGAGITNGEDAYAALELGSEGILLASGVVKAKDPHKVLMELAGAMRK
jgi:triosephosphate isomerase